MPGEVSHFILKPVERPGPNTVLTACPVFCTVCSSLIAGMGGPQRLAVCLGCIKRMCDGYLAPYALDPESTL